MSLFPTDCLVVFMLEKQIVSHYEDKIEQVSGSRYIDDAEEEGYQRGRSELLDEIKNYLENI